MKKLSLTLFVMFFTVSFSLAQNVSEIEQMGKKNEATIDQTGDRHDAGIYQGQFEGGSFGFGSKKNDATITQTGSEAGGYIFQGLNDALSAKNSAEITQEGTISNSSLEAYITQGEMGPGTKAERNNKATIDQTGAFLTGVIRQGVGSNSLAQSNSAKITQTGEGSGVVDINTAEINQGVNGTEAEDNTAEILQDGLGNTGTIIQGDGNLGSAAFNNTAEMFQYGNNNTAYTFQSGTGQTAYTYQDGNDNDATIQQDS